jgi:hypothetical protein
MVLDLYIPNLTYHILLMCTYSFWEEKEMPVNILKLLQQISKYIYHLCKSKSKAIPVTGREGA